MNKELQKFYFKSDIMGVLGYMGGLFVIMIVGNLFNGFVLDFGDYLEMATNNFSIISLGYIIAIYIHTLNKNTSDQCDNFSFTKRERFNFLATRYVLAVFIPQLIFGVLSIVVNMNGNPYYGFLIIDLILVALLNFVVPMFFVLVSGNMAVGVMGMVFGSSLSSVLVVYGPWSDYSRIIVWVGLGIFSVVMFFANRVVFEKREVEKIGKMFMFRWAEILFTICVTGTIVFLLNAIALPYLLSVLDYVLILILAVWVYMVIDTCFITGFKKEKIKEKVRPMTVLIPIGVTLAIALFFIFRIYELFN